MSESSELDEIRQRKMEELKQSLGEDGGAQSEHSDEEAGAPDEPIFVSDPQHFEEVVGKYDVVLVDFYADWCGPCQMIEPVVKELAAETDAAVAKVDVDAQQQLAMQYQVRGVPTVMLFANGEAAERMSGVRDKSFYERLIQQHAD